MNNPDGICVKWSCPLCGATGFIDPANDHDTAITGMQLTHRIASPDCEYAKEGECYHVGHSRPTR